MRRFIVKILPSFVINWYKNLKRQNRQKRLEYLKNTQQITTKESIKNELTSVGIKQGDTIMLHSSLSKIGYVEGGARTVIDAFLEIIDIHEGTLMMPSFPVIGFNYDYLKSNPVFDVQHTPSKMGAITEVFRKTEGVKRSLHPTDPVCSIGKQAEFLVRDHFNQLTPYNKQSPFYKLCELKGKIVLIGVDLNSLTNFHAAEDDIENFEFPVYHSQIFDTIMIDENGNKLTMKTKVHNPVYSKKRQCNAFIELFEKAGFLKHFKIDNADCMIIQANEMHGWMVENYHTKDISLYSPQGK